MMAIDRPCRRVQIVRAAVDWSLGPPAPHAIAVTGSRSLEPVKEIANLVECDFALPDGHGQETVQRARMT